MARAKRTDRTEARRRHRAEQAAELETSQDGDELVHDADVAVAAPARRKGTAPAGAAAATSTKAAAAPRAARPSFMASARAAYRAPNLREDLAYLPRLLIHWSVLVSAGLAVAGTAVLLAAGTGTDANGQVTTTTAGAIGGMLFSLFVGPPPFGAALLMGFMLPRATYLVGAIFGAVASACLTVVLISEADKIGGNIVAYALQAWVLGIIGTMFFTAGIAWYKRFLDLLNPNRGQRGKTQQKPPQGRGNAPRNRLSGSSR